MPPLSQYSEPVVDPMWFAVWCYVVAWLVIIIICIECPPRFYGFEPSDVINVASASWDWYFVSHLSLLL